MVKIIYEGVFVQISVSERRQVSLDILFHHKLKLVEQGSFIKHRSRAYTILARERKEINV